MKSRASFAGILLLLLLLLPLLLAQPDKARPAGHWDGTPPAVKTIYPTFTTIAVPGAGVTGVNGINSAGDMVGYYGADSNDPHKHGFLIKDGKLIRLDFPHAYATFAYGINDAGLIAGSAELQGGFLSVGFTYDGKNFTGFRDGSNAVTIPYSINNSGGMAGCAGSLYGTRGFEERSHSFKTVHFPGTNVYACASGINDFGAIVGFTDYDAYSFINRQFQNIDVPGAQQSAAYGIGKDGIIVGGYGVYAGCLCAFAEKDGEYLSFSYPGDETAATGVSSSGQIVGQYSPDGRTFYGFITNSITADFP